MLSQNMEQALNKQLNAEFYSAYLYLSMAAYYYSLNLNGFANWMTVQNQEETMHAMKFYNYINERGGRIQLAPIDGPPTNWNSPLEVFEETLKHEEKVTGLINNLVDLAIAERDHAANAFLQWFITEQVEEEASANEVIQNLKLAGNDPHALFMLDRELGTRVFTPPATAA
jgi:ferritin